MIKKIIIFWIGFALVFVPGHMLLKKTQWHQALQRQMKAEAAFMRAHADCF